jgi:hypothetical protein
LKRQLKRFSRKSLNIPTSDDAVPGQLNKQRIINQMTRALVGSPRRRGRPATRRLKLMAERNVVKRKRGRPRKIPLPIPTVTR